MCSRYELKTRPEELALRFRLADTPLDLANPEVRPTDPALIVARADDGARVARPARFGLAVDWGKNPVINARAETLRKKPTFRPLLGNRCLVPASAYFEWRQDGRARRRNRIALAGNGLMGFAGLFEADRFVIITCAAAGESPPPIYNNRREDSLAAAGESPPPIYNNRREDSLAAAAIARVHDRMPAILPIEAEDAWLDPDLSPARLAALLAPYAGAILAVEEPRPIPAQGDLFGGV